MAKRIFEMDFVMMRKKCILIEQIGCTVELLKSYYYLETSRDRKGPIADCIHNCVLLAKRKLSIKQSYIFG